jgi:cell division protein FtsW
MRKAASHGLDRVFLILVLIVVGFGLVMLTSASGPAGYEDYADSFYFVKHQILVGILPGLFLMFLTSRIPYTLYRTYALPMLLISVGLLTLVFIPGVGTDLNTFAKSWVQVGGFVFQPAEIVKLTFLFYLAAWMERRGSELKDFQAGLIPFLAILGVIAFLMIQQPDLGSLSIIASMAFIIYFAAGAPLTYLGGVGIIGAVIFTILVKTSEYRVNRLLTFLHPELDPLGAGYQINQALLAIGSGGLLGRGYGHSLQKHQYLPEVAGDSIFAVIGEELGFIFTTLFLCVFGAMIQRGLKIAERATDDFGRYLVIGIMGWFGVQAIVNVGAMLSLLPLTGVTLPFVSYGGTSLVVTLAAAGVVLNVSKGKPE